MQEVVAPFRGGVVKDKRVVPSSGDDNAFGLYVHYSSAFIFIHCKTQAMRPFFNRFR